MTDREIMQMALDALESSRVFVTSREKIKHPEGTEWYDERIEALRARLAQPEHGDGYRWREGDVPPSMTYTAPPQREWQGLTDEDVKSIVFVERSWADAVRKVEAKLKEKNG